MDRDPVELAMEEWEAGNGPKAEAMLLREAQTGSGLAAHNLGTLYATGAPGVSADVAKSRHWYEKALVSGFEAQVASDPTWFKRET